MNVLKHLVCSAGAAAFLCGRRVAACAISLALQCCQLIPPILFSRWARTQLIK